MIKVETKDHKCGFDLRITMKGKGGVIAHEIAAILQAIAEENEDGEKLVAFALEEYLDMRGFERDEDDEDD